MARRASRSYLTPHLFRRLFRGRETIAYPYGELAIEPAYRGQVAIDINRCVGCGRCARGCPTRAVTVERLEGGGLRIVLDNGRCAMCGLCVLACPRDAVQQLPAFVPPAVDKGVLRTEWERGPLPSEADDL
jgi:formate hydrogenlyase subunit 6/NADH:ubiquinone oxidoreductase subunit I